jgi:hypothetical protein
MYDSKLAVLRGRLIRLLSQSYILSKGQSNKMQVPDARMERVERESWKATEARRKGAR